MNFAQSNRNPTRYLTAITVVALLHLIGGYALVSGLARKAVEIVRAPVDVILVAEAKEPPPAPEPPPPQPPPEAPPPPPPPKAPPPKPKPKPVKPVVQVPKPPPKRVTPPSPSPPMPVAVAPPKAVPKPAPVQGPPQPAAVGVVCPNHGAVRNGVRYPPQAERMGLSGEVLIEFTVGAAGGVGNITVLKCSNPVFQSAAVSAVGRLQCRGQGRPVRVRIPFSFRSP